MKVKGKNKGRVPSLDTQDSHSKKTSGIPGFRHGDPSKYAEQQFKEEQGRDKPKPKKRKRKFPYRKVADIEDEIFTRETQIQTLTEDMLKPENVRDGDKMRELQLQIEQEDKAIKLLYEQWEEATNSTGSAVVAVNEEKDSATGRCPRSAETRQKDASSVKRVERRKMKIKPSNEHWSSKVGVVLAVAGSAVGLGNFLRFPGQVVNYGGGAFMIPYIISMLIVAIPISMSEWSLGRYGGRHGFHSPLGMYYVASGRKRRWGIVGGLSLSIPFIIDMYYIFVEAWCLYYAIKYLGGALEPLGLGFSIDGSAPGMKLGNGEAYKQFFGAVGASEHGALLFSGLPLLAITFFCVFLNFLLVIVGSRVEVQ